MYSNISVAEDNWMNVCCDQSCRRLILCWIVICSLYVAIYYKITGFTHIIQWPLTTGRSALWQTAPYANRFCVGESRLPDDCEWGLKLSTCISCIMQQTTSCQKDIQYLLESMDLYTYTILHIPASVLSKCSTEMVVASCNASSFSSPFSFSPVPRALISRTIQSAMQQRQDY